MNDASMNAMKAKLEQLREVMGDAYPELLKAYLEDAPRRISTISRAIEEDDLDRVAREAHAFKGSSSNMGARELVSLCNDLERCLDDGFHGQLTEIASQLREHFCAVEQMLKIEIESC